MRAMLIGVAMLGAASLHAGEPGVASPTTKPMEGQAMVDIAALQGVLAMQRLDGWLLYDFEGQNPIARELVKPRGIVSRRWFYFIPAVGEPTALIPRMEAEGFRDARGTKIEYSSWRELDAALRQVLRGKKRIAMEYSPMAALPALSRVDAGTLEWVKTTGAKVVSSAELVQAARSRWDAKGRVSHYVAVHHLTELRKEAFAFIADELRVGRPVTERDVQQRIWQGYATRGLTADGPPIVAAGEHTAMPHYAPPAEGAREIRRGDVVLIDLWAKQVDDPLAIYADMTWMGVADDVVPTKVAALFAVVAKARDDTVAMISDRAARRAPVRGFEADQVAREVIAKAGYGDRFVHRTGHSIDTHDHGDGANLDDLESHDDRAIVFGAGFSIEPGIYLPGELGVRSEIDCFLGPDGLEVTTPIQHEVTPMFAPELAGK